jgi:spore germination cell wall hydrolase CwlJ-like protein
MLNSSDKINLMTIVLIAPILIGIGVINYISKEEVKPQKGNVYIIDPPQHVWDLKYPVKDRDVKCLAENIYHESKGESTRGQYAVADVVMFRTEQRASTICGVVKEAKYRNGKPLYRKCKFSWFCDNLPDKINDYMGYKKALDIANEVIYNPYYIPVVKATYYHSITVRPYWTKGLVYVGRIGRHMFWDENV